MKLNLKFDRENLYRGEIPFYLESLGKNMVYLCSSKRNINDYYWVLKDIYPGEVIRPEDSSEEDYRNFNYKIIEALDRNQNFIVLVTLEFFLREYIFSGNRIRIALGESFNLKKMIEKLEMEGYTRNYLIDSRLQYSLRGDILDFFPVNGEHPIRVEFFDDRVERITYFHMDTQRSIEKLDEVDMYMENNKKPGENFLKLFSGGENGTDIQYIVENLEVLSYRFQEIIFENPGNRAELEERFQASIGKFREIKNLRLGNEELLRYQDYEEVKKISKERKIVVLSEEEARYREIFEAYSNIVIQKYPMYEGFHNGDTLYLTDRELKGIRVRREYRREIEVKRQEISAISKGEYIIHESFGVGIYMGTVLINDQEYLEVKYADQDKLFVPMGSLDRIEKFQVEPGMEPEIYKLGRKGFRKRRERLQDDMAKFALEIIEVQARRKLALGHRFGRDTLLQEEFEEAFPYNLTPDQNRAVEDTKRDMESGRVMDRIICGDVGCGKTEVAIRAAFKAAMDGKQVALMVPTTVLAQQHYERIVERLKNYPVTVELLSRIKTERELEECYKKIASGGIDIVVGTHKILSSEINFKDLGLVIIDEEQKFGVKAKEKLKTLRTNVHMLTLTATPIPRTLNLALLGIRDISIIETLPEGRLPIQDYFIEKKDEAIRDAVMREFAREGQSFYIYNRVKGIERREEELRKMLPGFLKIDHIHGQMPPREIREILHQFENGEIDLLLATTIVENGIDVENANSIIIEGTDKLGLSQMYQLRGRVGRGHERGYCYFLTDPGKDIRSKVKQREESMRSLGEMGAGTGFNLSMEDMRIRGAGEVLGERQHGAIEILGYGLYMKLLQEEIAKLKGEYIEELPEFTLDLTLPRYIPDTYIEEREKLILYKRIAQIGKLEDIGEIGEELEDRFGPMPYPVKSYLRGEKLKLMAKRARVIAIHEEKEGTTLIKFQEDKLHMEKLVEIMESGKGKYIRSQGALRYMGTPERFFRDYLG